MNELGEAQISILLDTKAYTNKPKDAGTITRRLEQNQQELTLTEIKDAILNGQSFCPSTFGGGARINENWQQQKLFCLDFDSGFTPKEFLKRLKDYGLSCCFIASTFSDTKELRKFRGFFQLETPLTDEETRDSVSQYLLTLFPEADKSCKDRARLFFGGKEEIFFDEGGFLNLMKLTDIAIVKEAAQIKRAGTRYNYLDEQCKKTDHLYNNKESDGFFSSFKKKYLEEARKRVKILDDFLSNKWLYHDALFGLATNLFYIDGGAKLFQNILRANPNYTEDKLLIMPYLKKRNKENIAYFPMRLENFSPYEEDHIYKNIFEARHNKGRIILLNQAEDNILVTLEDAQAIYSDKLSESLESEDKLIYGFKLPTGLGKTESYLELDEAAIIAQPNHALKDEVADRMRKKGNTNFVRTPALPQSISSDHRMKIQYLYNSGLHENVYPLIKSIIDDPNSSISEKRDLAIYLNDKRKALQSSCTTLTTHQMSFQTDFSSELVVYDEDPLQSILPMGCITDSDLTNLGYRLTNNSDRKEIEKLRSILKPFSDPDNEKNDCPVRIPELNFSDLDEIRRIIQHNEWDNQSNLFGLLNASYILVDHKNKSKYHYIVQLSLDENKKYTALSATLPEFIYQKLYGDRFRLFDLTNINYKGKVIQDVKYSCSKSSLRNQTAREYVLDKTKGLPVITFKEYVDLFNPEIEMPLYFGNCMGSDIFRGQDIAVVGTPHKPPFVYKLIASAIGIELTPADVIMSNQIIDFNGFRFPFFTFTNPELQMIQLQMIEAELIQAVGRARHLRENCIVKLFSNYPLKEAYIA